MADKPVTALDFLMDQHRQVEELFDELEDAESADERTEVCALICDNLAIHAKIEESYFYPAVQAARTEDILLESLEEHVQVKRAIVDLLALSATDERFLATANVLKESVQHHVEEEEGDLFPKVRKLFNTDRLVAIAQEMMAKVVELEGTDARKNVAKEIKAAAPLG